MKPPVVEKPPLPLRAIILLVMFIERAGGASEMNQCLTVMEKADHDAAVFVRTYIEMLRREGLL